MSKEQIDTQTLLRQDTLSTHKQKGSSRSQGFWVGWGMTDGVLHTTTSFPETIPLIQILMTQALQIERTALLLSYIP